MSQGADISRALATAVYRLEQVSDSPELDAALLLAHVLKKPRSYLISHREKRLSGAQQRDFNSVIARRARGEPVAYIEGFREFWSLRLAVTPDVLIPRPETETLVERALRIIPPGADWTVADLGTGSGAIALAVASERPRCRIIATDISPDALSVAAGNARLHRLDNVTFRVGDWCGALRGDRIEVLLSNPPYIREGDPHLSAPSLGFEPRRALVAPGSGMRWLRDIIAHAGEYLIPGGHIVLEHGADQAYAVRDMLIEHDFADPGHEADLAGHARISFARRRDGS